jgi:thymidylate synthase
MRDHKLSITYQLRSCDIYRHFQDDIYLTVRLLMWVLNELQIANPTYWGKVRYGDFIMLIGSLHCFENDFRLLKKEI